MLNNICRLSTSEIQMLQFDLNAHEINHVTFYLNTLLLRIYACMMHSNFDKLITQHYLDHLSFLISEFNRCCS